MGEGETADADRSRRLILAVSTVLRAAEPAEAAWQIRVHELARLLERVARADPHQPLHELAGSVPHLAIANEN